MNCNENYLHEPSYPLTKPVNFVGAGDAVSAIFILGKIKQWNMYTTIKRACQFASKIGEIQGAIPSNTSLYNKYQEKWFKNNG